ncbi:probable L-type lectin-domain containing receptor kinase VI.1 [Salvia miltiorrhiza]|uniref:probable L-type lectin-domain containing receptor kinase VI.1 n=1 Tax=Salvia miltiorrhiza TaxID=226208 RepID=UPI0025AB6E5F|nr:probable L-type lectin-domain containing receptor kinase VI.1 [Salvia miltiorrhiza]
MGGSSFLIQISLLLCIFFVTTQSFSFSFHGFNNQNITSDKETVINPSNGAIMLTNSAPNVIGHAFYRDPIPMFNTTLNRYNSFSTQFVFQINPSNGIDGGYGLAFTLSQSPQFPGAAAGHYMGVFNESNNGSSTNHVLMVEFDTVNGYDEGVDSDGNHVGINLNQINSNATKTAELYLQKASPIRAWIDFDGIKKQVSVTVARADKPKPNETLMKSDENLNLSTVLLNDMYAGFSAATGADKWSSHYILGWSFRLNGVADDLDSSRLPSLPVTDSPSSNNNYSKLMKTALTAALSVVLVIAAASLIGILMYRRWTKYEVLEEWELDSPHRFRYKELYDATKGFRDSEKIGSGGFGAVYRGVLSSTGVEIAVKKITSNNPLQGMREFAAEIESLGKLRHKNLVHLQGWCKRKNDLLLVYDYVPNGSLDSLLYNPNSGIVLSWEQRFNIIKGVASGLLYLHEDWEQVVIHRDVKSSNVLIDGDMSPRLGDFGLARLYDHGKNSHTTHVVGTIGYIAPELTRTGKASTSTDVFAYGILLLEIACGRAAVVCEAHQNAILVDWVVECMQMGSAFDAVDARMDSVYVVEEMELVLGLGLLCSHPKKEMRPTMRQVVRYLNGDEILPLLERLSFDGSRRVDEVTARLLELGLVDRINYSTDSYHLDVSMGVMSSTSFDVAGR